MINVDRRTIIQIFGSLMKKPELFSDVDKYQLDITDFSTYFDKLVFSAIYNLYTDGATEIHVVDIDNYLQNNEAAKKALEEENGIQFLQDCEVYSDAKNFNYYYTRLKKINLLKDLEKNGTDISEFYSDDPINPNHTEINERFDRLCAADIINKLKGKIDNLEKKYSLNSVVEESYAFDGVRELIKSLKNAPEIGIKLQGDIFNTVVRGGRKGKLYLRSASSGVGKALPNYTRIPTPSGWRTVGEIKVGDYLFDRFGKPTKVISVFPQKEKKQVYKVHFKSGRVAECCNEHLWSYYSNLNDKNPNKLLTSTLQEIIDNPKGLKRNDGRYRWSVPVAEPVQYSEKLYSVHPYVMGLILGDGSFRYNNTNKSFNFSSEDEELVKAICDLQNYSEYHKNSDKNYSWTFYFKSSAEHKKVWVEDILKEYPELWNLKSEDKFIPEEYMYGSVEQRFDLLAGLLDTDGSIDEKGRVRYDTISPQLRDAVIQLCESLGMTASYTEDTRDKYTTGVCYIVRIQASKENKVKMFKLSRKTIIAEKYLLNGKREERKDRDSIIDIEPTDNFVDMTCFYVDNDEHLFLMNNMIVTHNTRNAVGDACNIAYPIRYEERYGRWVATGGGEKVLYVMTEQDTSEIQTMILAYLTGINEEKFLYGTYDENDERIGIALRIMEQYKDNFLFARIPDPCASVIKNLFRRYNLQYGVENFFYDYIFSSPAMLEEYRDLKLPEYVCLRLFTTALKNLAIELNSFIMTSTQVSNDDENGGFKDYHNIQGARAIVNLVDFASIISRPTEQELDTIRGFERSFNIMPNCVTDVFKNRSGRWTMIRIWSLVDLGILRKQDLFVTTANTKPIDDFQVMEFSEDIPEEVLLLEEELNLGIKIDMSTGEIVEDIDKIKIVNDNEETFVDEICAAFGNQEQMKERFKEMDLDDLL